MNYFDYLRMTGLKDNEENFINYLVNICNYDLKGAKDYASFMYNHINIIKVGNKEVK